MDRRRYGILRMRAEGTRIIITNVLISESMVRRTSIIFVNVFVRESLGDIIFANVFVRSDIRVGSFVFVLTSLPKHRHV